MGPCFYGLKKLWFSGSMVVKNHGLWFYGLKKLWFSGSLVVKNMFSGSLVLKNYGPLVTLMYFCTYVF